MRPALPPSIALVVHDCQAGFGQGRYVIELLRHLSGRYQFHVVANRFDADLPEGTVRHTVRALRSHAITSILSFLIASERQIRRSGCTLIHAQGLTSWSADLITAHVCNAARHEHSPPTAWRRRLFPVLINPLERAFYQASRRMHLIAPSHSLAADITRHYGWNKPTTVIPHGTDTHRFRPSRDPAEKGDLRRRYGLNSQAWAWLFVGEASKGLSRVIQQLPSFPTACLLVVSRSEKQGLLQLAKSLGVAERVVWFGPDLEPELAYRAADLLAFPSTYDAFGLVVTEAMASELPVIASRHIGAAELIDDRKNGLLVEAPDGNSLRAALAWVQENPGEAHALAQAGRRTMLRCSWSECANRTATIYDTLLRASGVPESSLGKVV